MTPVRLSPEDARARLVAHDHGVLATVHPVRGVDAVPCVYAVVSGLDRDLDPDLVGVPVDTVKPKASGPLQRERNLLADPRATLLAEQWDAADWSRLWWVRAELAYVAEPSADDVEALAERLAERYVQYRDRPFSGMLVLRVGAVTGWAAAGPGEA